MGANGCCPCWRAGTISRSAASAEQRGPIVSSREVIPIQTSLARQILARYTCDSQEIRLGGDIDMPQSAATRWVLLIHQIPPKPDYFRVKVGRRLQRLGAVAIKNSAYVLPRLKRRLADIIAIDFFGAPRRRAAQEEFARLEARLRPPDAQVPVPAHAPQAPRGATWVTREGVYIDRIASAWLIGRFIDSKGQFKFVAAEGYRPRPGELRFDMFEAEYTHEGDACTFETLVARFGLGDRALRVIAEIVHDIDCKEAKFGRPEASGIERLIAGVAQQYTEDTARLAHGATLFDALYAALAATTAETGSARKTKP